ncbi:MAG: DUF3467 domain-containing protein [bacterium]
MSKENKNTNEEVTNDIQMYMKTDTASGNYSNYLKVSNNATEFIIDFFMHNPNGTFHTDRVIVNPLIIKDFVNTIKNNIEKYEEKYKINLPENSKIYIEKGVEKAKS